MVYQLDRVLVDRLERALKLVHDLNIKYFKKSILFEIIAL